MKKQITKTKTKTVSVVVAGVVLIAVAGLAAAAALVTFTPKLSVRLNRTVTSTSVTKGTETEMLGINFSALTIFGGSLFVEDLALHVIADNDASFATVENDIAAADYVSSCSLLNSSDILVSGPEPVEKGLLVFEDLDIEVNRGRTIFYKVTCDFANVDTVDSDSDIYALTLNSDSDLNVRASSGSLLAGRNIDIGGSGDPGVNANGQDVSVTVINSGTLTVSASSDMPASTIILGNSTSVPVASYAFTATDEDFEVKEVTLFNCIGYNNDNDCTDEVEEVGSDNVASVVTISYVTPSGETETKSNYLIDNYVVFSDMDMFVPVDERRNLTVTIETNSVSSTGSDSGNLIQLNFDTETINANFEAVGMDSGETLDEDSVVRPDSVAANDMVIRKTKPTVSLASGSPSGFGIPGFDEVFRFNVAADSRGYLTVDKLTFKVTSTDVDDGGWTHCDADNLGTATKWALYNIDDMSVEIDSEDTDWAFYDAVGTDCSADAALAWATLELDETTDNSEEIAAGETKVYILRVDTTGARKEEDDSIRIDIDTEANVDAGVSVATDAIEWNDDAVAEDVDGTLIRNLPVTGGTIIY